VKTQNRYDGISLCVILSQKMSDMNFLFLSRHCSSKYFTLLKYNNVLFIHECNCYDGTDTWRLTE